MDRPVLSQGNYWAKIVGGVGGLGGGYGNFATPRNIASIIFNQKPVIDDCDDDDWPIWYGEIYPEELEVLNFPSAVRLAILNAVMP